MKIKSYTLYYDTDLLCLSSSVLYTQPHLKLTHFGRLKFVSRLCVNRKRYLSDYFRSGFPTFREVRKGGRFWNSIQCFLLSGCKEDVIPLSRVIRFSSQSGEEGETIERWDKSVRNKQHNQRISRHCLMVFDLPDSVVAK